MLGWWEEGRVNEWLGSGHPDLCLEPFNRHSIYWWLVNMECGSLGSLPMRSHPFWKASCLRVWGKERQSKKHTACSQLLSRGTRKSVVNKWFLYRTSQILAWCLISSLCSRSHNLTSHWNSLQGYRQWRKCHYTNILLKCIIGWGSLLTWSILHC